jgi:hypothetical protein
MSLAALREPAVERLASHRMWLERSHPRPATIRGSGRRGSIAADCGAVMVTCRRFPGIDAGFPLRRLSVPEL